MVDGEMDIISSPFNSKDFTQIQLASRNSVKLSKKSARAAVLLFMNSLKSAYDQHCDGPLAFFGVGWIKPALKDSRSNPDRCRTRQTASRRPPKIRLEGRLGRTFSTLQWFDCSLKLDHLNGTLQFLNQTLKKTRIAKVLCLWEPVSGSSTVCMNSDLFSTLPPLLLIRADVDSTVVLLETAV